MQGAIQVLGFTFTLPYSYMLRIGHIEYSYADVFLLQWLVIYYMLLANKRRWNLVSRDKFPKGTASANSWDFRFLEELGSEIHSRFENQNAILFHSLWFHARKVDYRLSFLPRCMECRRGLPMRILSVRPSVCQTRDLWQNERKMCPNSYFMTYFGRIWFPGVKS